MARRSILIVVNMRVDELMYEPLNNKVDANPMLSLLRHSLTGV